MEIKQRKKFSVETRNKMRLAKLGHKQSLEQIEKRVAHIRGVKRPPRSKEWSKKISTAKKGVPNPKVSESLKKVYAEEKYIPWIKGKTYEDIYGKEKADIIKKNMGKQNIGRTNWSKGLTKETDERIKKRSQTSIFRDKDFLTKYQNRISKSLIKRPTSYEQKLSEILIKHNLPFIYTGNKTFLIGKKNPDFINEDNKIAIEVSEDYFKIKDYKSIENYEKQRSEYFARYGWKVIFIGTKDILNEDYENICLNKIEVKIK